MESVLGTDHPYTLSIKESIESLNNYVITTDQSKMKEYVFIANTIEGDTPAGRKCLSGEYIMLEFADWNILSETSLFDKINEMRGKPKRIVVMQGTEITELYFEDAIGMQFDLKHIGGNEKDRIIEAYEKWKKNQ